MHHENPTSVYCTADKVKGHALADKFQPAPLSTPERRKLVCEMITDRLKTMVSKIDTIRGYNFDLDYERLLSEAAQAIDSEIFVAAK